MLVLDPKYGEKIELVDKDSGSITTLHTYIRKTGNVSLAFDAPQSVRIYRKKIERKGDASAKLH